MPTATSSPLPAVVTIPDLDPVPASALVSTILFECVATSGGVANSYQVALNQLATTVFGGLPTGGGTGQILNKLDSSNYSAQWSSITQFVAVGTGLATSGSATSIVAAFATQPALSVLGVTGNATLEPAAIAGTAAQVLRVNDAGNALAFGAVNLGSSAAVTGVLPAINGGTNNTTYTAFGAAYANGTAQLAATAAGTTGWPLLGAGTAAAPAFGQLNVASAVTGVLPVPNGGTNTSTLTAFGTLYGNGSATVGITAAGTTGWPLLGNGTAAAPSFQQINLASAGLTGVLGVPNGGTNTSTLTLNGVVFGNGTSTVGITAAGATGSVLVSASGGAPTFTTAPVIGTSVTVPTIIGGTLTTSNLTMQAGTGGSVITQFGGTTFLSVATGAITYNGPILAINTTVANIQFKNFTGSLYNAIGNGVGHYLIFTNPNGTTMFQGGDSTDPTIYFSHVNINFTNQALTSTYMHLDINGMGLGTTTVIGTGSMNAVGKAAVLNNTALSSTATAALLIGSIASFGIWVGTGVPAVAAGTGSLFLRNDGTTATSRAYINTNGGTTWTAVNTVA